MAADNDFRSKYESRIESQFILLVGAERTPTALLGSRTFPSQEKDGQNFGWRWRPDLELIEPARDPDR